MPPDFKRLMRSKAALPQIATVAFSLFFGFGTWQPGFADEGDKISLWNGKAPIDEKTTEAADATIYVHRPDKPNGAAVVICPGGGYGGLVMGGEGHGIAKWLNSNGIVGVVLQYRLPRGNPYRPVSDVQRAIRTVRSRAEEWGIDPKRVGVIGFSAGGHLASTAATQFDEGDKKSTDPVEKLSSRPDFAVLVYPVITMGEATHKGSRQRLLGADPDPDLVRRYSGELQVTKETPPCYLTHALDDKVVVPENSKEFHHSLEKVGVSTEYLELPSGGHGLNGYKGPMWDAWQTQSLTWLESLKLSSKATRDE